MNSYRLKNIEKILLVITGISIPLIGIRFDLSTFSISLYMALIIILLVYNCRLTFKNISFQKYELLIVIFLIVTLISTLYSINATYGLVRWLKLLFVVVLYFGMKYLFMKKPQYINIIMKIASYTLAVYLMYLMWHYLIKFNLTYIGPVTEYGTRSGKNALSFMAAFVTPFTFVWIFQKSSKWKIVRILVIVITLIGVILIQSRGLYILILYYSIASSILNKKNLGGLKKYFSVLIILLIISTHFAPDYLTNDLMARISSIQAVFNDNYVISENNAGRSSIDKRSSLIEKGIDIFSENPVIGAGLGSFMFYDDDSFISHNDYILVLAEQGIIGLLIFIVLIFNYVKLSYLNYKYEKRNLDIFLVMSGLSIYLLFINAYDNFYLWTTMAMVSSINTNTRKNLTKNNVQ